VIRIEGSGLLGLTAPVTPAGAITQYLAEFFALNTVLQELNPGHPVVMSEYTGSGDLITGSKAAMRPEAMIVKLGISSMARYYEIPTGWYLQGDSSKADAQAAWEHMATYLLSTLFRVNLVMSSGGMTSADTVSFRQIVIDNEIMGWAKHLAKTFEVNENTIPLDVMKKVSFGPLGNSFLGEDHTAKFYRDNIWRRSSITNPYLRDAWIERGSKTIEERSRDKADELLRKHKPKMSDAHLERIRDFMYQVLIREKVNPDEAKKIMEKTYFQE
jgi:trimethylamine--corrinoid protein Co-methyltransferase